MQSRKLKMERGGRSNSKPTTRVPTSGVEDGNSNGGHQGSKRDPDHYMPIATLMRITHRVLPANAKVADDAKEAIQECVSEFISLITREANERCHREYRRTITPNDVVSAMAALGFTNYVDPLTVYLNKHRTAQEYFPPRAVQEYYNTPRATHEFYPPRAPMEQPPPAMAGGYVPSPLPPVADGGGYNVELPPVTDYLMGYRGGGEGSSGDMDFDPFG